MLSLEVSSLENLLEEVQNLLKFFKFAKTKTPSRHAIK